MLLIFLGRLLCPTSDNRLLQAVYHVVVVYPEFLVMGWWGRIFSKTARIACKARGRGIQFHQKKHTTRTTSAFIKIFTQNGKKSGIMKTVLFCRVFFPRSGVSRNEHFVPMLQTVFV